MFRPGANTGLNFTALVTGVFKMFQEEEGHFSTNEDFLSVLIVNYVLLIIFLSFYEKKVLQLKLLITH